MKVTIESFTAPLDATIADQINESFTTGGGQGNIYNVVSTNVNTGDTQLGAPVVVAAGAETDILTIAAVATGGATLLILGSAALAGAALACTVKFYVNGIVQSAIPLTVAGAMTWGLVVSPTIAGALVLKLSVANTGANALTVSAATLAGVEFL